MDNELVGTDGIRLKVARNNQSGNHPLFILTNPETYSGLE